MSATRRTDDGEPARLMVQQRPARLSPHAGLETLLVRVDDGVVVPHGHHGRARLAKVSLFPRASASLCAMYRQVSRYAKGVAMYQS